MVSIIGSISVTICGISDAIRSKSGIMAAKSSDIDPMPSRLSNTDRSAQHTGMSKQCGSQ